MSTRRLKWLGFILPVGFWIGLFLVRALLWEEEIQWVIELLVFVIVAVGVFLFSNWIFQIVENREKEIRKRSEQLAALREAGLVLTTELDLGAVLQKVVDLSRQLVKARYGALGVLDENGVYIEQFITSGISKEIRKRIGDPPRGFGLLGVLIHEGKSIRIDNIEEDPRAVGFPPNHPIMNSLLGVPIVSKGKVIGDLYLANKIPEEEGAEGTKTRFNRHDQQILEMFAIQAAIAIENAKLYRQTQQLAILQERERFGMDLHDGIIQSIYAIGLMLEDAQHNIDMEFNGSVDGISRAINGLNNVIRDIRNYILDLRPQRFQGRDLKDGLEEIARELRAHTFLNVILNTDGVDSRTISPEKTVGILHITQEALTNVRKHARASEVCVDLKVNEKDLVLTVEDDGVGIREKDIEKSKGNGLGNMFERAKALNGDIQFKTRTAGGTRVYLQVPLKD